MNVSKSCSLQRNLIGLKPLKMSLFTLKKQQIKTMLYIKHVIFE